MRKKYLSALLFGALLVTSTGTFTSCKDYDDEINGLQEQIDKVVTDLESLEATVNKLGGYVTDVKIEDGKLLVTVDGGTPVSYELPAGAEMEEIKIENGHLYVGSEDKGAVGGSKVEVNEEGVLVIDDEATEIKVGTDVVIKDSSNGIYTIQIGNETIQLPMASANITLEAGPVRVFTNSKYDYSDGIYGGGILWGTASKDVEWDGPKGDVKKDQLLVGQINLVNVSVLPATFDLSTVDLELVDTEGNPAPVKVTAEPAGSEDALTAPGRAADKSGKWNLSIEMKSDVTSSNIATSFATGKNNDDKNYLYAIKANGVVVSRYDFAIDTDVNKTIDPIENIWAVNCKLGDVEIKYNVTNEVPLGNSIFKYNDDKAYDYYITFAGKDINDAEYKGVTIKDNVITASDDAAGQEIEFDVHVLDITGNVIDHEMRFKVKFEGSTTEATELATTNHVASPTFEDDGLVIDLGTTFSGLTAEEATLVNKVKWTTEDGEFIFAATNIANKNYVLNNVVIKYFKDAECKQEVTGVGSDETWDGVTNIREIKYAKLTGAYNLDAEVGAHNATLTLFKTNNSVDSELKKVTVPVNVTLPNFDDICIKSATWTENEEEANFRLTTAGKLNIMTAYKLADDVTVGTNGTDNNLVVEFDKVELEDGSLVSPIGGYGTAGSDADQNTVTIDDLSAIPVVSVNAYALDEDYMLTELSAVSKFVIGGVEGFTVKSAKYSVKLTTILDGTKLVYLGSDKKETTPTINGTSGAFTSLTSIKGPAAAAADVIALKFDSEYYQLNGNELLDGNTIYQDNWSFEFNANAGEDVKADYSDKKLTIDDLPSKGQNYTIEMTPVYTGAVKVDGNAGEVNVVTKLPAVTINVVQAND